MLTSMEELVLNCFLNMVLNCFHDPHPRVRWAAIRAIALFSTFFCPQLQEQFHDQVLPTLAAAMADFQNPIIQVLSYADMNPLLMLQFPKCNFNYHSYREQFCKQSAKILSSALLQWHYINHTVEHL